MSQDKEYQALARSFVDLWQERMSAMMQDGEFVRLLLKMVHGMPFSATTNPASGESSIHEFTSSKSQSGGAAHASGARDAAMADLAERLASIERSLAELANKRTSAKVRRVKRVVAKVAKQPQTKSRRRVRGKK